MQRHLKYQQLATTTSCMCKKCQKKILLFSRKRTLTQQITTTPKESSMKQPALAIKTYLAVGSWDYSSFPQETRQPPEPALATGRAEPKPNQSSPATTLLWPSPEKQVKQRTAVWHNSSSRYLVVLKLRTPLLSNPVPPSTIFYLGDVCVRCDLAVLTSATYRPVYFLCTC